MIVASLALLALTILGAARAEPVTVRDAFDRSVTVPGPPQRIVTIFASNTEMVAALGLTDRIVGIEAFTRFPPEVLGKPLVGGRLGFSVDAVVARKPDLVVVTPSRQAANQLIDPMERLGIPIVVLLQRNVEEILSNIRLLARLAGVPERGEALAARLQARLDAVARSVADLPAPSVVMITGRLGNGLMLVTRPGTYTGGAIVRAGGRLAFDSGTIAQVSPEAILNADPDVLLFAGSEKDMKELTSRPGWNGMRAVKSKRAHAVSRAELLIPGPRTIDGVEKLAALLHPMTATR
ncbi:ABC transporter substrate-binding protein [Reyranella sp.]|uniref:ABC transporter substrate-binding protein n=1 Tax=Reyranella sp. TaxID=1929291 RepID=UPI0037841C67